MSRLRALRAAGAALLNAGRRRVRVFAGDVVLTVGPLAMYGTKALLARVRKLRAFHVGLVKLGLGVGLLCVTSISATAARFGGRAACCVLAGWLLLGGILLAGDELEIRVPW